MFSVDLKKLTDLLQSLSFLLSNTLYPISCVGCGEKEVGLCAKCLAVLPPPDFKQEEEVVAVFSYQNKIVKRAIWKLKYRNGRYLAPILAEALYERLLLELADLKLLKNWSDAVLIPVPLSTKRFKKRGYNQAELLAEALIEKDAGENFILKKDILLRAVDTPPQAEIKNKGERKNNVRGCFAVKNKDLVRGKNIILIDDVSTTGATLHEAEKTLKKSGARNFLKITVAK